MRFVCLQSVFMNRKELLKYRATFQKVKIIRLVLCISFCTLQSFSRLWSSSLGSSNIKGVRKKCYPSVFVNNSGFIKATEMYHTWIFSSFLWLFKHVSRIFMTQVLFDQWCRQYKASIFSFASKILYFLCKKSNEINRKLAF